MPDDEQYTLCPLCRQKVDPADRDVRYAVEVKRLDATAGPQYVEGMGGYFHENCPIPSNWKAKSRIVVFKRGTGTVELSRDEAIKVRDWATEGPHEQAVHRKIRDALRTESDRATIALTDNDFYDLRAALFLVLNVIEEKDPPLTPAQQQLRELAIRPPLP